MHLEIEQKELVNALKAITGLVPRGSTLPVLAHIGVIAQNGDLTLKTTNLEQTASVMPEADVFEEGALLLPARCLEAVIKPITGRLTIKADKQQCTISTDNGVYHINGMNPSDWPPSPEQPLTAETQFQEGVFHKALSRVIDAVSSDIDRPILNGVLLQGNKKKITCVATDGRRLHLATAPTRKPFEHEVQGIIPREAALHLLKNTRPDSEQILLSYIREKDAEFRWGVHLLQTQLIQGEYPDFQQIITGQGPCGITVEANALRQAIRSAAAIAPKQDGSIRLEVKNGKLGVKCQAAELGDACVTLQCKSIKPEPITIAPQYLLDALKNIDLESVTLECAGKNTGVYISEGAFQALVMPRREA